MVLDPFGGSGTTNYICAKTGRKSIYIDNSKRAYNFAIKRVKSAYIDLFLK